MATISAVPLETTKSIRVWCSFHVALAALVGITVYLFCGKSVADPDIWWHLKNAQILIHQHHWIRYDSYSFTVHGTPWVNSEWLSEVIYYAAWAMGGLKGIFLLYLGMAEAIMLGLFYLTYKVSESIKAAFLVNCVAVTLAVVNFGPRTILFGWACMVVMLLILWRFETRGQGPLWALPVLFCMWANFHGSWLIGFVVFGIIFSAGLLQGSWGNIEATRWSKTQLRRLSATGIAIIGALFINPYGYKLVIYPFDLAYRQKLNVAHIEEWASVDFHEVRGKIVLMVIMALLLLAWRAKDKWKLSEVALIAFTLYASLTYVRFLFLAAIILTPILARKITFLPPYKREVDKPWLNAAVVAAVVVLMLWRLPSNRTLEQDVSSKFPTQAISFLQQHPGMRVLNHYMWGGYMIWATPPAPTFIDSRTDIFEYKGVLKDYLDLIQLKDSLAVMDRYKIDLVLFPAKDPVTYLLRNSSQWKLVYEDKVACIFARTGVSLAK
ncbi:MAG: hypothetical protein ACYC0Z_09800 [Acidobacteriaceae bacterium]